MMARQHAKRFVHDTEGAMGVWGLILFMTICTIVGLSMDVSNAFKVRSEMQVTLRRWIVKVVAWLALCVCLLLFLVLAGVAVMIGTMQDRRHWILLLVPSVPLLMAVVALMVALRKTHLSPVCTIRQQFIADVAAFTGPAAKNHEK